MIHKYHSIYQSNIESSSMSRPPANIRVKQTPVAGKDPYGVQIHGNSNVDICWARSNPYLAFYTTRRERFHIPTLPTIAPTISLPSAPSRRRPGRRKRPRRIRRPLFNRWGGVSINRKYYQWL